MPLAAGNRIGPYQILEPIGKGGMGEVYRARDTMLERHVAIKVLPAAFASAPERLARFEREAKVLASLNHPGIAAIYGVEERAIVMELVPGPTLGARIAQGPIRVEETIEILYQIAEALEYAHDRGVIHRDLKPDNIKLDPDCKVKILDFGLAKALSEPAPPGEDPTDSPTVTIGATVAGTILGTAAYMAPEQALGKRVDKRADIWAFGVVVWEMLAGERLFKGESTVEVLGKVLEQQPDLERVPERFRKLLARCLDRDAKGRLRDIGEARFLLSEPPPATASAPPRASLLWPAAAALLAVSLAALAFVHFREAPPEARIVRSVIPPPEKTTFAFTTNFGPMALSPDGRSMVFAASGDDGVSRLWIRPLDSGSAQPLAGTEGGTFPFWSPDSRWVGFFAGGKLKKIDTRGGPPIALADAPNGRGGSWSTSGVIVFAPSNTVANALLKISSTGGKRHARHGRGCGCGN